MVQRILVKEVNVFFYHKLLDRLFMMKGKHCLMIFKPTFVWATVDGLMHPLVSNLAKLAPAFPVSCLNIDGNTCGPEQGHQWDIEALPSAGYNPPSAPPWL